MRARPASIVLALALSACVAAPGPRPHRAGPEPEPDAPVAPAASTTTAEPAPEPAAGPAPSGPSPTYPPLLVGRFDTTDPKGPKAAWPGTRIVTRFEGTAVSVRLRDFAEDWMEGVPTYWDVSIDHGPPRALELVVDDRPHAYELASGLAPGVHEVELFKRTETQTGITQLLGFDLHGGRSLPPPARQARRIEALGDSQASGFGIEMLDAPDLDCPGADHSGRYQNFHKAWPALVGARFDAEVHGIVYSGKGLLRNVWPTDDDTLLDYYARTNPDPEIAKSAQLFDLHSWEPDVILMTQGSVDFGEDVDVGAFRAAYRKFVLETLRPRAPHAHIFMCVLGKGGRGTIDDVGREIVAERAAEGDDRMHVFVATPYETSEMNACNSHGNPGWHARIAGELATAIHEAVGW